MAQTAVFFNRVPLPGLEPTDRHRGWYITQAPLMSPDWSQYIIDVQ
jgi:hypothetical protein